MRKPSILAAALYLSLAIAGGLHAGTEETLTVQPGDSLYKIVRLQYPDSAESWLAITRDILALNPEAFRNGDPATLRVGTVLRLPDYTSPAQAPMPVPVDATEETAVTATETPKLPRVVIGEVIQLDGDVLAIDINGRERQLSVAGKIYRGDALRSGSGGARVMMYDGAELLLRPSSRAVLDDYAFIQTDAAANRCLIKLTEGGMRVITGLIARNNPEGFSVQTSVAIFGGNGTDFAVRICGTNDCLLPDGSPLQRGVYTGVLNGDVSVATDDGKVYVTRGNIVHTRSRNVAPEPAPEAAQVLFTSDEWAMLEPEAAQAMGFLQWLRAWVTGNL